MNEQIDLIVFDWDGTLVDSVEKILDCIAMSFMQKGFDQPCREASKALIGKSLPVFIQTLLPAESDAVIQELCHQYRWNWQHGGLPEVVAFDGVPQMLSRLREQGYLLAVATGKSKAGLELDIERVNLRMFFHATRCADESGSKPDPAMLIWICTQCDVKPERTLVVGDTTHDLEMAKRAGAKSIGVLSGCHNLEQLSQFEPLTLLDKTTELETWLNMKKIMD